jgi:streptogramin lyase
VLGGSRPAGLAVGPDGNVWFMDPWSPTIGKMTPEGVLSEFPLPKQWPGAAAFQASVAAWPDGNVWNTRGRAIGRVTPSGAATEYDLPSDIVARLPSSDELGSVTADPDGDRWVHAARRFHDRTLQDRPPERRTERSRRDTSTSSRPNEPASTPPAATPG